MPVDPSIVTSLPEYPRWVALLDAAGLSSHRDALDGLLRPTIALDVEPGPVDDHSSRLGGPAYLPPNLAWPTWRDTPLAFVAQLRLDETLLALDLEHRLPSHGLLSVFVHLGVPDHAAHCALLWHPRVDGLAVREAPGPRLSLPGVGRWVPRLALSVPRGQRDEVRQILPDLDARDAFHDDVCLALLPPSPDHRLFGHPSATSWMEDRGKTFVLQVDSDDRVGLELGDVETLRVYADGPRLDEAALSRAVCTCDEG